jgi:nucleotide-binding universal stress UspA family protein
MMTNPPPHPCCCVYSAGVGDSLVEFAKAKGVDMVAVGSRGMGSMKRSLMSLVGLGSVSDYVLHQLHVVRMPL